MDLNELLNLNTPTPPEEGEVTEQVEQKEEGEKEQQAPAPTPPDNSELDLARKQIAELMQSNQQANAAIAQLAAQKKEAVAKDPAPQLAPPEDADPDVVDYVQKALQRQRAELEDARKKELEQLRNEYQQDRYQQTVQAAGTVQTQFKKDLDSKNMAPLYEEVLKYMNDNQVPETIRSQPAAWEEALKVVVGEKALQKMNTPQPAPVAGHIRNTPGPAPAPSTPEDQALAQHVYARLGVNQVDDKVGEVLDQGAVSIDDYAAAIVRSQQ